MGLRGEAGPPGLPGDLTELDIFPELRLDYTVDKACADSIRANYEFGGTTEEIAQQRQALEIVLGLPTRYMSEYQNSRLRSMMDRLRYDNDSQICDRSEDALEVFRRLRYSNPMGTLWEDALHVYWGCTYPGEGFRLLNGGYSYDDDECNSLLRLDAGVVEAACARTIVSRCPKDTDEALAPVNAVFNGNRRRPHLDLA